MNFQRLRATVPINLPAWLREWRRDRWSWDTERKEWNFPTKIHFPIILLRRPGDVWIVHYLFSWTPYYISSGFTLFALHEYYRILVYTQLKTMILCEMIECGKKLSRSKNPTWKLITEAACIVFIRSISNQRRGNQCAQHPKREILMRF